MVETIQMIFWILLFAGLAIWAFRAKANPNQLRWRHVAALGNNPFAKVSVIAPLVAPLALYTNDLAKLLNKYFSLNVDTDGLYWLYFSLLFLSVAQFIYNFRAPEQLKEFKSRNDYAANGGADLTDKGWNEISAHLANRELANLDKPLFAVSSTEEFEKEAPVNSNNPHTSARAALRSFWERGVIATEHVEGFRRAIETFDKALFRGGDSNVEFRYVRHVLNLSDKTTRNPELIETLRKELRTLYYDAQNSDRRVSLYIVAALYLIGLSYFLWHIPNNIIKNVVELAARLIS